MEKLLKAGANRDAGWWGCDGQTLLHAGELRCPKSAEGQSACHQHYSAPSCGGRREGSRCKSADHGRGGCERPRQRERHTVELGHRGGSHRSCCSAERIPKKKSGGSQYYPTTSLHTSVDEVVSAPILKGINLNCLHFVETPLVIAVQKGRVSTVKVLIAGGADASFRDDVSKIALHVAVECDRAAIIPALVEAGSDIEAQNALGQTPLFHAAMLGLREAMFSLLHPGASVHTKAKDGYTPLHIACEEGQTDAADLLLQQGADKTAVATNGKTPSEVAPLSAGGAEGDRPRLERLWMLLASAQQDRAWRGRGFLVMCRAHPDRVRLAVDIPMRRPG